MSKKRRIFIGITFAIFLGIAATFGIIRHQLGTPPDCRIDDQGRVMTITLNYTGSFWHRVFLVSPPGVCLPPKDFKDCKNNPETCTHPSPNWSAQPLDVE